jgi:hypothetical protein
VAAFSKDQIFYLWNAFVGLGALIHCQNKPISLHRIWTMCLEREFGDLRLQYRCVHSMHRNLDCLSKDGILSELQMGRERSHMKNGNHRTRVILDRSRVASFDVQQEFPAIVMAQIIHVVKGVPIKGSLKTHGTLFYVDLDRANPLLGSLLTRLRSLDTIQGSKSGGFSRRSKISTESVCPRT